MKREARAIGNHAVVVGAGDEAGSQLPELLHDMKPDVVLIAGICGALDPTLAVGDVVISRSALMAGCQELLADPACVEAARDALTGSGNDPPSTRFLAGGLLTVNTPDTTPRQRRDLWDTLGASAIDMETYALARAASSHGVPWLALRAVSDAAHMRLPAPIATWRSEADDRRIALAIARRPWDWPSTIRLARDLRAALRSLARAIAVVTDALDRMVVSMVALDHERMSRSSDSTRPTPR